MNLRNVLNVKVAIEKSLTKVRKLNGIVVKVYAKFLLGLSKPFSTVGTWLYRQHVKALDYLRNYHA